MNKKILTVTIFILILSMFGCSMREPIVVTSKNEYGKNQYNRYTGICQQDGYIYSSKDREIYRYNTTDATKVKIAGFKMYQLTAVSGDYVFATTLAEFSGTYGYGLFKIRIDGSGKKQILKDYMIIDFNIWNDTIYFCADNGLYSSDINGENIVSIVKGSINSFYLEDNKIYYYLYKEYRLCRYDCNTKGIETIYENRAFTSWIIKDEMLYYAAAPTDCFILGENTTESLCSYNMSTQEEKTIYEYSLYSSFLFMLYDDKLWIADDIYNSAPDYFYTKVITASTDGNIIEEKRITSRPSNLIILNNILYAMDSANPIYFTKLSDAENESK